jgi:hypothetical protein
MKKVLYIITAIAIVSVACLKNEIVAPSLNIKSAEASIILPTSEEDVTITAVVTEREHTITSVVIEWRIDTAQTPITMTAGANNTYTGTIPKQTDGTSVSWSVKATNSKGDTDSSALGNITWTDVLPYYAYLKLNEVSGAGGDNEKFYELINIGSEPIDLEGFTLWYNANSANGGALPSGDGNHTWTGCADQVIQPGELLVLMGRGNPCSFTTGLTSQRTLRITLKTPDGTVVDVCIRNGDTGEFAITEQSFSRIPDGTGKFYFTPTRTPGVMNGDNSAGLILVPQP